MDDNHDANILVLAQFRLPSYSAHSTLRMAVDSLHAEHHKGFHFPCKGKRLDHSPFQQRCHIVLSNKDATELD